MAVLEVLPQFFDLLILLVISHVRSDLVLHVLVHILRELEFGLDNLKLLF